MIKHKKCDLMITFYLRYQENYLKFQFFFVRTFSFFVVLILGLFLLIIDLHKVSMLLFKCFSV